MTVQHGFARRRALALMGGAALSPLAPFAPLATLAHAASGEPTFPSETPIKVLIGVPAGGTQDVLTRAIAQEVRASIGPIIVDNRAGASGRIAVDNVKNAAPDAHTLLLGTASMMTMYPHAYRDLKYDPLKDFLPIMLAARFELALTVHKDVPANNLAEFITWAKAQGERVSFGSYGAGTPSHFLGEMLNRAAGLKMVHIPYKGSTPARQDVMGGTIPVYFDTVGGAITMLETGRVKALATSGPVPSPLMPKLPCFAQSGYKDVVATAWFAYYAPRKTPPAAVETLRREFIRAVKVPAVNDLLLANGMVPVGVGADELVATMHEDSARWAAIMKATHFQAND